MSEIDILDRANLAAELHLQNALDNHKKLARTILPKTGKCLFCDEKTSKKVSFCIPSKHDIQDGYSCEAEYQKMKQAKIRNGR